MDGFEEAKEERLDVATAEPDTATGGAEPADTVIAGGDNAAGCRGKNRFCSHWRPAFPGEVGDAPEVATDPAGDAPRVDVAAAIGRCTEEDAKIARHSPAPAGSIKAATFSS